MNERILIAEDEDILRTNLTEFLASAGYVVDSAADCYPLLEQIEERLAKGERP